MIASDLLVLVFESVIFYMLLMPYSGQVAKV